MQDMTFIREQKLFEEGFLPIGIDEAGRGPLAGPVVAAAVCLKKSVLDILASAHGREYMLKREKELRLIRDSKKLSPKQREEAFELVQGLFHISVGIIHSDTIDRVNILQATFLAMKAAISGLLSKIQSIPVNNGRRESVYLLIDGNQSLPNISYKQEAIVDGDGLVKSIAAASIIAKVTRDRLIIEADKLYPGYGLAQHKGYGTKEHMDALRRLGPSPIHRMSFGPVFLSIPENMNRKMARIGLGRRSGIAKSHKS